MGNILKGIDGERFPIIGGITRYSVTFTETADISSVNDDQILWQVYWSNEYSEYEKVPFSGQKKGRVTTYKFLQNLQGKNLQLKATYKGETAELHITPQANGEVKIVDIFFLDVEYKIQNTDNLKYLNSVNLQIYTLNMMGKYVEFKIYDTVDGRDVEVAKSSEPMQIVQKNGIVKTKKSILLSPAMYIQTQQNMSASEHHYKVKVWEKDNEANFYEEELKIKNELGQMSVPQDSQTPVKTGTSEPLKKEEEVKKGDGKCFCDRDLELEELKLIVKQLRLSEKIISTSLFSDENCPLLNSDKTYDKLLEELNKTFSKYHINTCIRKIHFLSQSYHETSRLGTTLEYASGKGYDPGKHSESSAHGHTIVGDGPRYKGRGAMQLTWRDTQKEYFEYIISKNSPLVGNKKIDELFNRKKQYQEKYIYFKDKLDKNGKPIINSKGKKEREKVIDLIDVDSAGLLANNLFFAIDSAGWFWDIYKTIEYGSKANKEKYKEILHKNLNEVSDYGDKYLTIISKFVNGGGNGMAERHVYYNELKNNVFKFNTKCVNRSKIKK
ncbi:hypothetical protein GCM10022217_40720 [Chryseobacterium ginsenosidimutans]|uniref:hypothetical protein n=1 Tax=Chryseobacterium ginsenosidimutans TaxID=687846 RepID=UPI0031E17D13